MGGRNGLVEGLTPEASTELSLPDAAVAEEDHLHLVLGLGPEVKLRKIGAQPWEAVVAVISRENLSRCAHRLIGKKSNQARVVSEGTKEYAWDGLAVIEAEAPKSLESCQRGQVRHSPAAPQI
jgi:hypothetical protein